MSELSHIAALENCFDGLRQVLMGRLRKLKGEDLEKAPKISPEAIGRAFVPFLPQKELQILEGLVLVLALVPHMRPQLFDRALQEVFPKGGDFPELGGLRVKNHQGFLPTGTTALYLLGGDDLEQRFFVQSLLSQDHWFAQSQIMKLGNTETGIPTLSGQLILDPELVEKLSIGKVSRPAFSSEFPASYVSTDMEWEDLILSESTQHRINDIFIWLKHHKTLLQDWEFGHKFKPGYRALFFGAPGTGKTLTATLLGKSTNRDVYKIDLSTVVSKYIGETEKNLANLFDRAENKEWILFFDEADALFGKRTQVQNAHDRYANQEVSYLLQRIENFSGLVILASNLKNNIDEAFLRRFQAMIHFPMPKTYERLKLWEKTFPPQITFEEDVNLKQIAQTYELTGADILNIVQRLCLRALELNQLKFSREYILNGIRGEVSKGNNIS